jgi:hypothetical protein
MAALEVPLSLPAVAFPSGHNWPISEAKSLMAAESYHSVLVRSQLVRRVEGEQYGEHVEGAKRNSSRELWRGRSIWLSSVPRCSAVEIDMKSLKLIRCMWRMKNIFFQSVPRSSDENVDPNSTYIRIRVPGLGLLEDRYGFSNWVHSQGSRK